MTPHNKGILQAYTALLSMGIGIAVVNAISINSYTLVFYRCVLAIPLLYLFVRQTQQSLHIQSSDRSSVACAGVLTGLHWVTLFISMRLGGIGIGMISFYTYPVLATLLEAFVQQRRPRGVDIAIATITIVGVAMLTPITGADSALLPAVLVGVLSGFFWAFRIVLVHHKLRSVPSGTIMFWNLAIIAVVFSPAIFYGPLPHEWGGNELLKIVFLGLFVTGFCHTLLLMSLRNISATLLGQIGPSQILAASLAGWAFLGEPLTLRMVLGGLIISAAGLAASYTHKQKPGTATTQPK